MGQLHIHTKKKKVSWPLLFTVYKNQFHIDCTLNARGKTNKALMWKQREYL